MAVYARGYRSYEGTFRALPPAWSIFAEGARMALARKGVRRIYVFILIAFCVFCGILYFQFGVEERLGPVGQGASFGLKELLSLNSHMRGFHQVSTLLASLAAVLVGAGLIADDLRTRALSLYLVRPIRPVDYMIGKALILPALLVPLLLLPGLLLYLLVGSWQPPGASWAFLRENVDIALRVIKLYVFGALSLTGLMLLLSSRTPRRGAVIGMAAAVLFGGMFLRAVGRQVGGTIGEVLKACDLTNNMMHELKLASSTRVERMLRWLPETSSVWIVSVGLVVVGLVFAWRRARSVEVGE